MPYIETVYILIKKYKFNLKTAVITGLILSIVAPLIVTPIVVLVYGGVTGSGTDLVFAWLLATGKKIFAAAFISRITGNFVDKIASCIIVALLITKLPIKLFDRELSKNE